MGFFIPHLIFWFAVEIVFNPGTIVIQAGKAPTVVYDTNKKSWAIPSYDNLKHAIKCIERDRVICLKGRK